MEDTTLVNKSKKNPYLGMGVVVIAIVAILAVGAITSQSRNKSATSMTASPAGAQHMQTTANPAMMAANDSYKNGEYSVIGSYVSPGGAEEVGVNLTIEDNIITAVEFEPKATRPISVKFQGIFAENYNEFVVGKNINEVKLDKVSGSSLTPKGFNDALDKIKAEAKV